MKGGPRLLAMGLALGLVPPALQAATCPPVDPGPAGHYVLQGEHEVGSQLLLRPDGSFAFMLAYGAIDQAGTGCWSVAGTTLALRARGRTAIPRSHSPDERLFRGMYLLVRPDGDLAWPLPGFRGRYVRQ